MPSSYAGSNVFPASFNIPSDGDARNAASVNVGFEALADRTIWLQNRTLPSGGGFLLVNCGTIATDWTGHGGFTSLYDPSENKYLTAITCNDGDLIEFSVGTTIHRTLLAAGRNLIRLGVSEDSTNGLDGSWADAGNSERSVGWGATDTNEQPDIPYQFHALYQVTSGLSVKFAIQGDEHVAPVTAATLVGGCWKVLRGV